MSQTCKIWKSLTFNRQAVHYVINGPRKGPVTSATIKGLFDKKEIESDAQVRRKGMSESKSLRQRICVNLRIHPNAQPVAKINLDQPKVGRLGSTT